MEVVYIFAVQYDSHYPHVATEDLEHGWCDWGTEVLILLIFIIFFQAKLYPPFFFF